MKIIDVWPDEVPDHPKLGGYQQMLSADILRGRYRQDPANPQPIEPEKVLPYRLRLPNVSHMFLPGHRIMVQIQSTWFPLYDRNPQTYVPNIMYAKPEDFVKATQRIWHTPRRRAPSNCPWSRGVPGDGKLKYALRNYVLARYRRRHRRHARAAGG